MRPALTRALTRALTLLVVAALAASGCDDTTSTGVDSYVALGDSFTSGAGLPQTERSATACGQSALSYPRLVASSIGADLTDVSCGGAGTGNGAQPQPVAHTTWPPQLDALEKGTDLVTVGLGGNDYGWFLGVMFTCAALAAEDPTGHPCQDRATTPAWDVTEVPSRVGSGLEDLLLEVHRRSPHARVVLVGYPQPVPAEGTCPELPLAAGDYAFVRAQWEAMNAAMRAAAHAAGATYVDVLGPSRGHDICAGDEAWVNGATAQPGIAAAYHPFRQEQEAVAALVERALRQ